MIVVTVLAILLVLKVWKVSQTLFKENISAYLQFWLR